MNRSWNKRRIESIVPCNNKWEESNYGNPANASTNPFFKPYLKPQEQNNIKKRDELSQMKRKDNKMNDEQPYKRIYKAEKFEAIKYPLGPNEEYIAIKNVNTMLGKGTKIACLKSTKKFFGKRTKYGWKREPSKEC
ncbi:hypothetical protein Tco_0514958 [Tanacetum coccineum]